MIDAHHHVWNLSVRDQPWIAGADLAPLRRDFGVEDLEPLARASGVTGMVVVQTITVPEETPELLALAETHDLITGVVGWIDLTGPDVAGEIERLREGPGGRSLKAFRHQVQGEPDPRWLCRPDVRRGLAAVAAAGLAYDLLLVPSQLEAAAETAAALPELRFVLDHLGKPPIASGTLRPWEADLGALAKHGNVTAKLSGLVTEAHWRTWTLADLRPYVDVALDAFGPDRLMTGSDWPVCLLAATYSEAVDANRVLIAGLSRAERHAILVGTASREYRLA